MGRRLFSGEDGSILRTITSTKAGENLGFDAVGIGDVNRDGILDALLAAATGDHVYVVAGVRSSLHGHH
ncbi:MAG TPA: hypothetical protein VNT04_04730 [Gaiellaceae bacterium]|nr:hypothetical protein [Gaiellaceae bacterium]